MRLCSGAGCGRKVADDVRYCDECKKERGTSTSEIKTHTFSYTQELDDLRKGTRWQRIRQTVLGRCPVCARCNQAISEIADHIVPAGVAVQQARDSGRYPYDKYAGYYLLSNLQGLCRPCHHLKTIEDKQHTGPWPDVVEKEAAAPRKQWGF